LQQVRKNRKRGAAKAAATRRLRRQAKLHAAESMEVTEDSVSDIQAAAVLCGVCGEVYEDVTDEVENWVGCENCPQWFHFGCAGIITAPDKYLCYECVKQ